MLSLHSLIGKGIAMTAWKFLIELNLACSFQTKEGKKAGKASNSELKRWFLNGVVFANGERLQFDEVIDFPITSMVLFQNSTNRVTLF